MTPKQLDGSLLSPNAQGMATYKMAGGQTYAVGDYLVLEVVQTGGAAPGTITDSLGNTYTQFPPRISDDGSIGYALYVCQVSVAGSRPTLTFALSGPGMFGLRGCTGVNLATDARGRSMALNSANIASPSIQPYIASADAHSAGDLVMACIVALGNETFSVDPFQTPGWTVVRTFSGNNVSLQILEQSPAAAGTFIAAWDATPDTAAVVVSALGLAHS